MKSVVVKDLVAAGQFGECCGRLLAAVHLPSTGEITFLLSFCLILVSSHTPSKLFGSLLQVLSCTLPMSKQPTVSVLYNSPLFVVCGFVSLLFVVFYFVKGCFTMLWNFHPFFFCFLSHYLITNFGLILCVHLYISIRFTKCKTFVISAFHTEVKVQVYDYFIRTCNKLWKFYENILTETSNQINEHERLCLTSKIYI